MRSEGLGKFDLDMSWQSVDDWDQLQFSELSLDQITRIAAYAKRIAAETEEIALVHRVYREVGEGNKIGAIKRYRELHEAEYGVRPSLLDAKLACIDNYTPLSKEA